jgi:WD40 repeat protein
LTLRGHNGDVRTVAYSPDGKRLVTGGSDGWLKFWEPTTGQEILTIYDAHLDCVNAVAFSKDGGRLASASCDGTVVVWNGAPTD